jgi:hypothetical protein
MVVRMVRFVILVALLGALSAAAGLSGIAQEATPGTEVAGVTNLAPDAPYAGATRGEWDARSWQWAVSMPEEINPGFDTTGELCGYGQHGPVFFLPGAYTPESFERTCVVPEGVALFVGIGGSECSTVEPPPFFGRNEQELRECAAAFTDTITDLHLTINGEELPNLEAYRTVSPMFTMTFPEDNFFGVPAGAAYSVSDGYSVILAPLPPGEYEVTGSATFSGEDTLESTTRVIVVSPQIIEPPAASPEAGTPTASPEA